ncbi:hypothetical protein DL767_003070 [Monosporascus sp. MG133]|nr:hypothetical protein DL767_003070 [Monosporascus sp. MG133]
MSSIQSRPDICLGRFMYKLPSNINLHRFQNAWDSVVKANSILRTRLVQTELGVLQVVSKEAPKLFVHENLEEWLKAEASKGTRPGLCWVRLAVIEADEKLDSPIFAFTIHHTLFDHVSLSLLLSQVEAAYDERLLEPISVSKSITPMTPENRVKYRRFLEHQFQDLQRTVFPPLPLQGGNQPITRSYHEHFFDFSYQRDVGFTPSVMVQLAWSIVMSRHIDSNDVLYALSKISGDSHRKGYPVSPASVLVPVRISLRQDQPVRENALKMQREADTTDEASLEGFMSHLAIHSRVDRQVCREMLFNDCIGGHNQIFPTCAMDLNITYLGDKGQLRATFSFDKAAFDEGMVECLGHQLENVLKQVSENADQLLMNIKLVSPWDLSRLASWNSVHPEAHNACIHDMVLEQCMSSGETTAVSSWDGTLTYQDLDHLSSVLSHHLIEIGVRTSTMVPLAFEKGKWMPIAVLAVLRAGGTCVPLDPSQPEGRLSAILQDSRATIALASPLNKDCLRGVEKVVEVSQGFFDTLEPHSNEKPPVVSPSDVAFIFYTSGSTGKPKGVVMEHQNTATGMRNLNAKMNLRPGLRVLHFASYAFDASIHEMLNAFITGGCLCIPSKSERTDLAAFIRKERITWAILTPSIAAHLSPSDVPTLETLVSTGETMSRSNVDRLSQALTLINAFGPTETAFCCAVEQVRPGRRPGSVGFVVNGLGWISKADDPSRLCAIGEIGELLVEGPALAQGYLHDPELTAAAFISAPVWRSQFPESACRLYRTGDLVKYNSDGSLLFIGRKDTQVKVRGQRVELGEVDYHVEKVIGENVVVAAEVIKPSSSNNSMLVAFLAFRQAAAGVCRHGHDGDALEKLMASGLRAKLEQSLPSSMVPAAFIPLDQIPLTASGKTDRRRLQEIGRSLTLSQLAALQPDRRPFRAPATEMEQKLVAICAAVLGMDVSNISADDSFLRIGGDSIGVLRLVSEARTRGFSLVAADVFNSPRLCDIASSMTTTAPVELDIAPFSLLAPGIDESYARAKAAALCGLASPAVEEVFPCTPLQEGLLAETMKKPGSYVSRNVVELQEDVDMSRFQAAWQQVIRATPILRTRIVDLPRQGLVQVVLDELPQWTTGRNLDAFLQQLQSQATMGLGTPLSHYALVIHDNKKRYFVWTKHHAIFDGWSVPLLLKQVEAAYGGHMADVLTPFQGYIKYILHTGKNACQYWEDEFRSSGAVAFPALPSAKYQPKADYTVQHQISALKWHHDNDITPSTVVRAAWALLTAQYANHPDVVFGATVTGRNAPLPGIEQLAGPTITTVPVRFVINWEETVSNLLQRVQKQAIEMIGFEHLGLQNIRKISNEVNQNSQFGALLIVQPASAVLTMHNYGGELFHQTEDDLWGIDELDSFNSYALMTECQLQPNGANLRLSGDSQAIPQAHAQRIVRQMEHLLRSICAMGAQRTLTRDIANPSDMDLHDIWNWNATAPVAVEVTVPDLFSKWTRLRPQALAICAWDGSLTYAKLDELSTQLAQHLVSRGVGSGLIVCICFEKSLWTSVAIMSVIKTGAAISVMDITQPKGRLRSIVEQAQPVIIIASPTAADLASGLSTVPVMVVGADVVLHLRTDGNVSPTLPVVRPSDRLYVAFTSGTTGKPKGVIITHQNITTALHYQPNIFGLSPDARLFDFSSYSFDVSLLNLFYVLGNGACLCVPSEKSRRDNITKAMQELAVTTACLTPSTARLIQPTAVPSLRSLSLAGEPMEKQDVVLWASHVDLKNVYGPTECISSLIKDVDERRYEVGNIGRGYGLATWVVTLSGDRLAPIGAVGELWLEGPLVGDGYLGDPEKTAACFKENPSWLLRGGGPGQQGRPGRAYKTGDLARYTANGEIVLVGRKDAQVKIRGQRVELGEVEHHIRQALGERGPVPPVVVEVIEPRGSSNSALVGYFGVGEESKGSPEDVRAILQDLTEGLQELLSSQLPAYMIPSFYITIDAIPLTGTGKTNRRRIREIGEALTLEQLADLQPAAASSRGCEPKTEVERQLQNLWASILGVNVSRVGMNDTFFQLGGDSIAAMRLVAAARSQSLVITVRDVFDKQRLCELAKVVQNKDQESNDEIVPAFSLLPPNVNAGYARSRAASQCGVSDTQIEDIFPCTAIQQGVLSISMKKPQQCVARGIYRLGRDVDTERFQRAWEEVVSTLAPTLRTRVVDLPTLGLMQAVVAGDLDWNISLDLQSYLNLDKQMPMGLGTALARFALVKDNFDTSKQLFVWTKHHCVYDGWSVPLILKQVEKVYRCQAPEPPTAFSRFVKYVVQIDQEQARRYWLSQLQDSDSAMFPNLPPKHQPHADRIMRYQVSDIQWPRNDITPSTIVRAAWAILAAQYTNSSDVIFGATVNGRSAPVPGIDRVIGPTMATVPVRVVIDWEKTTVSKFLERVQQQAVGMIPFEQIGLQKIGRMFQDLNDGVSQGGLFQTLLVVQPVPSAHPTSDGASLFLTEDDNGDRKDNIDMNSFNPYALMIEFQLKPAGVVLQLGYDSCIIEPTQASRIVKQLDHIMHQICGKPETMLQEIRTASRTDMDDIWTWNTDVQPPVQACVHDLIAEQVLKSPDSPAICAWDGDMTYRELDELSTRLAHRLVKLNVHNTVVALCFEKSLWTPVAMLGVMKAGGASVAMDMNQPENRLRSILQQAQVNVILSSAKYGAFSARLGVKTQVLVDRAGLQQSDMSHSGDLPTVNPSSRLYVVFTSGSTGKPKGVVISHSNFASAIKYQQHLLGFESKARVYDFASYSFDAAWSNILHSVSSGGCLCIPSDSSRKDDIGGSITQMGATYADLTPSTARLIDPANTTLKTLVLAGEPIADQDIVTWASRLTLMNTYGPAECSVTATTTGRLSPNDKKGDIGRGVGLVTWVVEPSGGHDLVPIGATGELWLEGPMVGHGYLGDAQKTEASFVENPAWLLRGGWKRPGRHGRLYKTGDLVKYNMDGSLTFIGRKDDGRIKIRGQLVELGEIEHAIRQNFPCVRDVVADVITSPGEEGRTMLAAFIWTGHPGKHDSASQEILASPTEAFRSLSTAIETCLSALLPIYMIPAICIPLRRIPTLGSGKTDRRCLRELGGSFTQEDIRNYSYVSSTKRSPSIEAEHMLRRLWAQTLNINEADIGMDDSFFKLGGDSISAMQLSGKCRSAGFHITVAQIFQHRSISRLASHATAGSANTMLISVEEPAEVPFPLSPIQQFFFETQPPDRHNHFYQSFLLHVTKAISSTDMVRALESVVGQHPMLRARFRKVPDKGWTQSITANMHGSFRYREHEFVSLPESSDDFDGAKASLDIQSGPLLAADLIKTQDKGQYLFLMAHHLVIDLVSWRIILEDLEGMLTRGALITSPSLSFQTWCRMQAQYCLQHLAPETALPFEVPTPPFDYWGPIARQKNTYGDIRKRTFTVDNHVTDALLGPANNAFRTEPVEILQATLLHAFVNVFHDRPPPTIFNEGHGREPWDSAMDISRTVGWFTTMWPTTILVENRQDLSEMVRRTKDCRRSVPRKGWSYFTSRYLNPRGRKIFAAHEQIEILFNFEGRYQQFEKPDALFRHEGSAWNDQLPIAMQSLNRAALIEVSVTNNNDCLQFSFHYNKHMEHQDLLNDWVSRCKLTLEDAASVLVREVPTYTTSDFPLLHLRYDELGIFISESLPQAGISPAEIEEVYPCTPTQELMLRAHFKQPKFYTTTSISAARASPDRGPMSIPKLISAWEALVKRFTALRTVFLPFGDGNKWVQLVLKDANATAEFLSTKYPDDKALKSLAAQEAVDGPKARLPARLTVCQTQAGEVLFKLEISHAIMDAASRAVLFDEWSREYMGRHSERKITSYSEYIGHVHSISDTGTEYWAKYLKHAQPCLFPAASTSYEEARNLRSVQVIFGRVDVLRKFSQQSAFTLPTLVKTAWALLLQRELGQSSVCFGYFDSGRHALVANIDDIVGAVANILVCRVELNESVSLRYVLEAMQDDYHQSLAHHTSAMRALDVLELAPPSRHLFNTLVNYRKEPSTAAAAQAGIQFDLISGEDGMEFDIVLNVNDLEDRLEVFLDFWESRIPTAVVTQVSSLLQSILATMLDDIDQPAFSVHSS